MRTWIFLLLIFSFIFSQTAYAQAPVPQKQDWKSSLKKMDLGSKVEITMVSGKTVTGKYRNAGADEVTISSNNGDISIPYDQIKKLKHKRLPKILTLPVTIPLTIVLAVPVIIFCSLFTCGG